MVEESASSNVRLVGIISFLQPSMEDSAFLRSISLDIAEPDPIEKNFVFFHSG